MRIPTYLPILIFKIIIMTNLLEMERNFELKVAFPRRGAARLGAARGSACRASLNFADRASGHAPPRA